MSIRQFVEAHRQLMQRDDTRMALDFALLEYQQRLAKVQATDTVTAMANQFKAQGAVEFVDCLVKLAESSLLPQPKPIENLNHRA